MAIHSEVRRFLRGGFTSDELMDLLDELRRTKSGVDKSTHSDLKKQVKEEGNVVPVLDYLEEKRLFGPGNYDWLCGFLDESNLRIAADGIRREAGLPEVQPTEARKMHKGPGDGE